ncbi:MAG: N,N-dimethylformamidase beta subunit family domain-containing protein [Actinomycetota bacterium]
MTVKFSLKSGRREFLKAFLIGLAAPFATRIPAAYSQLPSSPPITPTANNPTALENQKPGTTDWQLSNPATNREIEGYASLTSVNRGGTIQLFVNTKSPTYSLEIFRMGWYQGAGARRVAGPITCKGIQQPAPLEDPASGLVECNWKDPYILTIPKEPGAWTSGVYLAKLTANKTGKQSYIIFVVRDDARSSDLLFQSSVTTFQAYNNWGNKSLYRWNSKAKQAYKVSFNRPYAKSPNAAATYGVGAGEFLTNFQPKRRTSNAGWEYNMVRWLEREGYDVTYATNIDTHFNDRLLLKHKAFLSVGHDEYWSWEMRQNVELARNAGVSLGFFGANICYWQIRLEPSRITKDLNRTIVAYKEMADQDPLGEINVGRNEIAPFNAVASLPPYHPGKVTSPNRVVYHNPANESRITTLWRDQLVGQPEDALIGVMYETFQVNSDIVIDSTAPSWLLEKTGLKTGDRLPGLLGYEVDRMFGNAPKNTIRIAHSPYAYKSSTRYSDMTVYQADSGATVFATGSIQWAWGLDDYNAPKLRPSVLNAAAQQLTRNVLARLIGS